MEIRSTVNTDRVCLGNVLPLDTPFTVILDVSEACNLRCNYCFRSFGLQEYGYALKNDLMSFDTLKLAVEQIKQFPSPVKKISLSGNGEPLCNRHLPEMAAYVKEELNLVTEIYTNATLLTDENIKRLAQANIDRLVISLQGLNAQKYQEVCGKDIDFKQFRHNIESLYRQNLHGKIFIKIVDVALATGEEELFYSMFGDICHRIFIEKARDIWIKPQTNSAAVPLQENKFGDVIGPQYCCSLSFYTLFVTPCGDAYPCSQPLMDKMLGNLYTTPLVDMWNSEKRKAFLLSQLNRGCSQIKSCANCNISHNSINSPLDSINAYREDIRRRLLACK